MEKVDALLDESASGLSELLHKFTHEAVEARTKDLKETRNQHDYQPDKPVDGSASASPAGTKWPEVAAAMKRDDIAQKEKRAAEKRAAGDEKKKRVAEEKKRVAEEKKKREAPEKKRVAEEKKREKKQEKKKREMQLWHALPF